MTNTKKPNVSEKRRSLLEGHSSECLLYIVRRQERDKQNYFMTKNLLKRDFHFIVEIMSLLLKLILFSVEM